MAIARIQISGTTDNASFNRTHVADEARKLVREGTEFVIEELVLDDQPTRHGTDYEAVLVVTKWP